MTARTTARPTRASRLVAGIVLVLLAFAVSSVGWSGAVAQEGDAEPIDIDESTLYVSPVTDAIPPTLTSNVPPGAFCIVFHPHACREDTQEIRDGLRDGIGTVLDESQDLPIQPVPEESAAVSLFGGHTRYQTAIKFDPPRVPEGQEPISAVLTLDQEQPSYDFNSPFFRSIFFSVFAALGEGTDDREAVLARFVEEFTAAVEALVPEDAEDENELDRSLSRVIGVEACPLLSPFEPEGTPEASPDEDMPSRDDEGDQVADVDCILGASGVFDERAETWSFDLGFALAMWDSGELDNHGVLLRPTGSPNLAFGDPDTSTTAQIVLDLESATMELTTAEAFDPDAFGDFDAGSDDSFDSGSFDAGGDDFGTTDVPLDAGGSADFGGDVPMDDPSVADDLEAAPEAAEEPAVALDAGADRPGPQTPWWVWSVIPLLLGGAWLTGSALLAPAPVAASAGGGALTRMIARNAAGAPTAL